MCLIDTNPHSIFKKTFYQGDATISGLPTIREVARLADVSVATVSKALNGTGFVSEELLARVVAAATQLGYAPHASARSLRSGASRILGLLVADITNPFFLTLVDALEKRASDAGYSVILCNSAEDPQRERRNLQLLLSQRADGMILVPTRDTWHGRVAALSRLPFPAVLLDRQLDGLDFDSVTIDNRMAGSLAAEHLYALGHHKVAVIMGSPDLSIARHRLEGFREAFAGHGVFIEDRLVEKMVFDDAGAFTAAQRLIAGPDRPTAIVATNNHLALGMLRAVANAGLVVPRDMSILAIDDLPWFDVIRPRVTVVVQPSDAIANRCMEILLERVRSAAGLALPVEHIVLEPTILARDSTARHIG